MDRNEKERIGVVLHLDRNEYQTSIIEWGFELPPDYKISLESLSWCRYVAFVVDGVMKSVGEINRWSFDTGNAGTRSATIVLRSDSVQELADDLRRDIKALQWLTNYQGELIAQVMAETRVKQKPSDDLPTLDLQEAATAVARRFNVKAEQVEINVRLTAYRTVGSD
jgi:hypothetical protein